MDSVNIRKGPVHSNFIKLNVARLLFLDFALSYERKISPKISVELETGYQYPIEYHFHSPEGNPFFIFETLLPGQGFSLEGGPKIYGLNHKNPGFYICPWVIFKNMWCTDVSFPSHVYGDMEECYPYGDNQYQVYGVTFRIGIMKEFRHFVLDFYTGVGFKVKNNHYKLYGYWADETQSFFLYNEDGSPVTTQKVTASPALNLGLKLGFGFD